jgi:copper chaperone
MTNATATTTYHVSGMTCEHCVRAVTSELGGLGGVTSVTVDLVPGGVSSITVTSDATLPDQAVSEALDEAGGYRLTASLSPLPGSLTRTRSSLPSPATAADPPPRRGYRATACGVISAGTGTLLA